MSTTTAPQAPPTVRAPARATGPRRRRRNPAGIYILLVVLAMLFVGPFGWLVLAALKTKAEWVALPTHILPGHAQWKNFHEALTAINFPAYTANSLFLSSMYAILVTL